MRGDGNKVTVDRPVVRYALAAVAIWSAVVLASTAWNIRNERAQADNLALNTARASFNKDLAYRLWATTHGGVYVPPDERTPPNPHLAHLPDRDVVTTDGKRLTLMNPAYMLRQMMDEFSALYGIKGRIFGDVALNPNNRADPWEMKALEDFQDGTAEVVEMTGEGAGRHLRLVRPMFMEEGCIKCHGHLGFKEGDLRGGIGVSVPMAPYDALADTAVLTMGATHGGLWLLGMGGIAFAARRARRRMAENRDYQDQLRVAAQVFDSGLEAMMITDASGRIVRVNPAFSDITGFSAQEVVGRTPAVLKSERHPPAFYKEMWRLLAVEGSWQGEIWNRRKDGEVFPAWESIVAQHEGRGEDAAVEGYIAAFRDITDKKLSEERIHHLAYYDVLTNLPNRTALKESIGHTLSWARRRARRVAVLFIDLDEFKDVNDSFGHPIGDQLLVCMAQRLAGTLAPGDYVARMGGDEFIVVIEDMEGEDEIAVTAGRLLDVLARPVDLEGQEVFVSASIGIAVFPDNGSDADTLVRNADIAMYRAKETGRNRYQFYSREMAEAAAERIALEAALRRGLDARQFVVHYQPRVDPASGRPVGAEALVRWQHPEQGMIAPMRFIPLAEKTGLITRLTGQVLEMACAEAAAWEAAGLGPLTLSVNVSGADLASGGIAETVRRVLEASNLESERLELEVTETYVMSQEEEALAELEAIRALGVRLAVDDFGTGQSSLSYLKRLPIDILKIDKSFVDGVAEGGDDAAIVSTIVAMARTLKLSTVAEGVETPAQLSFMSALGCGQIQGYLFSRPLPAADFRTWVLEHNRAEA